MRVLSLLKPEEIEQIGGLNSRVICGTFENENMAPEFFKENKEFVDLMQTIIETQGCNLPSLIQAAQNQKEGYLYVIDLRTPEGVMGNVPIEDIIGGFKVHEDKVVENAYWKNDAHKIFTKNGLVKLPPDLFRLVVDELKRIGGHKS